MADLILKVSYLVCAGAFAALAGLALFSGNKTRQFVWLVTASIVTVFWSLSLWATSSDIWAPPATVTVWIEILRSLSWVVFLLIITGLSERGAESLVKRVVAVGVAVPVLLMLFVTSFDFRPNVILDTDSYFFLTGLARLAVAILGLVLLENLYRNADIDQRWATKYLCIGLGLIFAYDFFFYAEAVIFRRLDIGLYGARGFVTALAAPLLAVSVSRARYWSIDIHVSRAMVFHTAAVMGTGVYLLVISAAGFYVSQFGGDAGAIFQILFLSLALILLVSIFASGTLRAKARVFISDNFYNAKYDYREEWLRFIGTLSSSEPSQSLYHRILAAITPIFESTAALIWVQGDSEEKLVPEVSWNFGETIAPLEPGHPILDAVLQDQSIRVFSDDDEGPLSRVNHRKVSLIVPLSHEGILQGVLVLGEPRSGRTFGSEDKRLLETIALQAASYIAEARAANALSRAQKLEEFNQRFAFIAHDMKNIVNQLSIMVQNADKHGANPEFQKDMVNTVSNSVDRMKTMMADLTAHRDQETVATVEQMTTPLIDLQLSLAEFVKEWQAVRPDLSAELEINASSIRAEKEKLNAALGHIMQNAIDAAGESGAVSLHAQVRDDKALIDISDTGPGMTADFIENTFFAPFKSTKSGGYGIGGFQIRQLIREMGGKLEVLSEPGQGTTLRVALPINTNAAQETMS